MLHYVYGIDNVRRIDIIYLWYGWSVIPHWTTKNQLEMQRVVEGNKVRTEETQRNGYRAFILMYRISVKHVFLIFKCLLNAVICMKPTNGSVKFLFWLVLWHSTYVQFFRGLCVANIRLGFCVMLYWLSFLGAHNLLYPK